MLKAEIIPYTLFFKFLARTSRETFTQKKTYFIEVFDDKTPTLRGIGEVAVFPSLQPSFTNFEDLELQLTEITTNIDEYFKGKTLPENSAIRFGVETALKDYCNSCNGSLYNSAILDKVNGGILINGLIWMNSIQSMLQQIEEKLNEGFKCLKLKIGAACFEEELELIRKIRAHYTKNILEIRVDANGAFKPNDVFEKLDKLAALDIHSIEQPLKRDNSFTKEVCRHSPVDIALDEDMIERWWSKEQMAEWLKDISPKYIIVKPSLIGGFDMADKWIDVAENLGIGWWATSALESNIGLNAITRWLATHPDNLDIPHGLGTGEIYSNNVSSKVYRHGQRIYLKI